MKTRPHVDAGLGEERAGDLARRRVEGDQVALAAIVVGVAVDGVAVERQSRRDRTRPRPCDRHTSLKTPFCRAPAPGFVAAGHGRAQRPVAVGEPGHVLLTPMLRRSRLLAVRESADRLVAANSTRCTARSPRLSKPSNRIMPGVDGIRSTTRSSRADDRARRNAGPDNCARLSSRADDRARRDAGPDDRVRLSSRANDRARRNAGPDDRVRLSSRANDRARRMPDPMIAFV